MPNLSTSSVQRENMFPANHCYSKEGTAIGYMYICKYLQYNVFLDTQRGRGRRGSVSF